MKLNDEQRALAENNIKLAYSRANYWKWLDIDYPEILSTAMLGLVHAAKNFDKNKGTFSTLCYYAIDNEVFKLIRSKKAAKRDGVTVSLQQTVTENQELEWVIGEEDQYTVENRSLVEYLLKDLDEEERELIDLYFYRRLSQKDIGDLLGVSQVHVSRRLRKIIQRIRNKKGVKK